MRRSAPALLLVCVACSSNPPAIPQLECKAPADWPQWALASDHRGVTCAEGQPLSRVLAQIPVDDNIENEKIEMRQSILVHYQAPLVVGDDVFLEHKAGTYTPCDPPGSGKAGCGPQAWAQQTWAERAFRWQGDQLVQRWSFESDWKPPPDGTPLGGWEPVFHAAVSGDAVYVPGAGGRLHIVDRETGQERLAVDPFGNALPDANTFLTAPVVVDAAGNALYSALKLDPTDPWGTRGGGADAQGFLVRVTPAGVATVRSYQQLATNAPAPGDGCEGQFSTNVYPRPWPPPDVNGQPVFPNQIRCGAQRAPVNSAPAVAADGTIFLVSRAHTAARSTFLLALNPDLSVRWSTSLSRVFNDGCGVLVPFGSNPGSCRPGARAGVDPSTNAPPSALAIDDGTSSPVALPDGGVLWGAFTSYNGFRGHLVKLSAQGQFVASYDFGWDVTPAVFAHDGTYAIVTKDNHYDSDGPYDLTQLDASLRPVWRYSSTEHQECTRRTDGSLACVDNGKHPNGFEWCVNSVAIDKRGVVYANSEDGNLYAIGPDGSVLERRFLNLSIGAAYTPLALDAAGRIYTQNDGKLFVVGR